MSKITKDINKNHKQPKNKVYVSGADPNNRKSLLWTYVLWLFGGVFGLHHFYLGRDIQAFLWWSTVGGYFGMGWLYDIFKIPGYVRQCNGDPQFVTSFIEKLKKNKKPPFSTDRFIGMVTVGYFWSLLLSIAIPEEEFMGIDWRFLHWLIPLATATGVWVVGNVGIQKGSILWAIVGAYLSYPVRWYIYDDSWWMSLVAVGSSLAFDTFSKQWRRTPPAKESLLKRVLVLIACAALYMSLWGSYLYFNGKVTDSEGEEVPLNEAIHHFFTSPWWTEFKQSMYDIWQYGQHHGWYEIWKQIIDMSDLQGEQNAYKVLGVSPTASQSEITSQWRKLSREYHPDKVKDSSKQRAAQEKFMEIQQAYEVLSSIKTKRKRRNKKFNDD